MVYVIAISSVLGAGLALHVIAQWRGWQPSLLNALVLGVVFRGTVWFFAASESWQPRDFRQDFPAAALAVLHHHDPVLSARVRGWPFPPTLAFVLAGQLKLGQLTHLPWPAVGRIVPVVSDIVLIVLVGKLAGHSGALRRFQYACNPIAIMVCALHSQLEPEVLALGVAAFIVARSARSNAAGVLLGMAVAIGIWPVLLLPGVLATLPDWRSRLRATCWVGALPAAFVLTSPLTVGTPVGRLPTVIHRIAGLRSIVGNWGWTVAVTHGRLQFVTPVGRFGLVALVITLGATVYLWRRADPVDLTTALLLAFLVVSPRVSVQYLAWPMPFLIARMTRFATPAIMAATAWEAFGYLGLGAHRTPPWVHAYMWYLASWDVIPLLIAAMPWQRRRGGADGSVPPTAEPMIPQPRRGDATPEGVSSRT